MSKLIGSRLRLARELAGVPKRTLASEIGITQQALNNYERGDRSPDADIVASIANVLNVSREFLVLPKKRETQRESALFFRSLRSSETKRRNQSFTALLQLIADDLKWIHGFLSFPTAQLPEVPREKRAWTADEIETVADQTRVLWGLGMKPIPKLVTLLESKGVFCFELPARDARIDAFSAIFDGMPLIATDADSPDRARRRFNLAHELGHLILHRSLTDEDLAESGTLGRVESEANRFAGAFLMPQSSFAAEMPVVSVATLKIAKPRWGASIAAMIYRSKDLELIDEKRASELFRQLSMKKWTRAGAEPGDDQLPEEKPRIVNAGFEALKSHWPQVLQQLSDDQHTPTKILRDGFGVAPPESNIIEFQPKLRPDFGLFTS
jgi:Zn-dependent peptidase ImmA (M78 family)/transcriptional regulator with XRE-family HTH domain